MLFEPGPLLDKAHEGGDPRPWADHDHRVGGLEGKAELGLADVHGDGGLVAVVGHQFVLQPVGGHALVDAAGLGFVLHHDGADVDAVGVDLQKMAEKLTRMLGSRVEMTRHMGRTHSSYRREWTPPVSIVS